MFRVIKKSRFLVATLLVVTFMAFIVGCSKVETTRASTQPSASQAPTQSVIPMATPTPKEKEPVVIKLAHVGSDVDPRQMSALEFKKYVEEKSAGSIKVEVYFGSQLGGDREAIEGVKLGTIGMTVAGAGIYANFHAPMSITALPFLFENFEDAWAFNDSDINRKVGEALLSSNIRILEYWENGFRVVTNNVKPINTPADLKGMKLRTPENPVILSTMEALGANPSPLACGEVYMALQQKAFDGQENPIPIIYANKIYEVQKYMSITNHIYEPMPLCIGEKLFQSLTKEQQQIILDGAVVSRDHNRALIKKQSEELKAKLKEKGMELNYPDLTPFREATANVKNKFVDSLGKELIDAAYGFGK